VSVSGSLSAINRDKLSRWAPAVKFVSARNLANIDSVRAEAAVPLSEALVDPMSGELPGWTSRVSESSGVTTFITIGRLSPEKNHARLLKAFAEVHRSHPATRLIIVGSGPLGEMLVDKAAALGVADAVIFAGHQSNPQAIMAVSDCFVLSSDYEGQPMVLLEALIVGLPIVTVAFGSVVDSLPAGTGTIVAQSVAGLAEGMTAFVEGEVPRVPFDAAAYNRDAIAEFYRAIGVDTAGSFILSSS